MTLEPSRAGAAHPSTEASGRAPRRSVVRLTAVLTVLALLAGLAIAEGLRARAGTPQADAAARAKAAAARAGAETPEAAVTGPALSVPSDPTNLEPVFPGVPDPSRCQAETGHVCTTATRLATAYGIDSLHAKGITGKGVTIAVIDASGAPSFAQDLQTFSNAMGLPASKLKVRTSSMVYGATRAYDPRDPGMAADALATTLQLQLIHAVAPDATILLDQVLLPARSPFPDSAAGRVASHIQLLSVRLRALVQARQAQVICVGAAIPEADVEAAGYGTLDTIRNLDAVFQDAARRGITVVASAGDPANGRLGWPADDPGVLAVGGTAPAVDANGLRTGGDSGSSARAWHGPGRSAEGRSRIFGRPSYQSEVGTLTGSWRGMPDLAMPAADAGAPVVYQSTSSQAGWTPLAGTGESAALVSGVVALAAQLAGGGLGSVVRPLYALAASDPKAAGLVDVTKGTGSGIGYDLATGWGTLDARRFVTALARAARPAEGQKKHEVQGRPAERSFGPSVFFRPGGPPAATPSPTPSATPAPGPGPTAGPTPSPSGAPTAGPATPARTPATTPAATPTTGPGATPTTGPVSRPTASPGATPRASGPAPRATPNPHPNSSPQPLLTGVGGPR